jgi:hypothetical protein
VRVALITACYGAYDPVRSLPADHGFDDAVLVTDSLDVVTEGWRVVVEPSELHPRLAAKRPKMMPWLYTDCDAAVWLDASFELNGGGLAKFARPMIAFQDFIAWVHPEGRIDISDEAEVSMMLQKYQGSKVREQAAFYKADGMPDKWGLFACGTLGWRFTPEAKRFGELWYEECVEWSVQDQISLPYLLWREGKSFRTWPANEYSNPYLTLRWDQRPDPQK